MLLFAHFLYRTRPELCRKQENITLKALNPTGFLSQHYHSHSLQGKYISPQIMKWIIQLTGEYQVWSYFA